MHFPTTLPPTSSSRATKLALERRSSPHPDTFDGPLPPSRPRFTRTELPLRPRLTAPRIIRLAGSKFQLECPPPIPPRPAAQRDIPQLEIRKFSPPRPPVNPEAISSSFTTAKSGIMGSPPSEWLVDARNSWKRKRKARLDGARKPNSIGSPKYGRDSPLFEDVREVVKKTGSLISTNSKQRLKKIFSIRQDDIPRELGKIEQERTQSMNPNSSQKSILNQLEKCCSSNTGNDNHYLGKARSSTITNSRERSMAACALREEEKNDFEENSNLDESDDRSPSETCRMSSQMSFPESRDHNDVCGLDKNFEKEPQLFRVQTSPRGSHKEHHRLIGTSSRRIDRTKGEPRAHQFLRANDRISTKEIGTTRISSAVRTAKARHKNKEVEGHVDIKRISAPTFSTPVYNFSSPFSNQPLESPNFPYVGDDSFSPPQIPGESPLNNATPQPIPRNRAYQQVFSVRPSSSYRPTLSPVYSKSSIPTNSLSQLAPASPKSWNIALGSPVSATPSIQEEKAILTLSESSLMKPRGHDTPENSLPSSTSTAARALQFANEIASLRIKRSSRRPGKSMKMEEDIPLFHLPSPEVKPVNWRKGPYMGCSNSKSTLPEMQKTVLPQNPVTYPPQSLGLRGIQSIPRPCEGFSNTPTSSALEFWAAADASLTPSESASAQPPNVRGVPPPDIWKDADKTLNLRKSGLTLEEWIASLPDLRLSLGPWVTDGNLVLKELRAESPKTPTARRDKSLRTIFAEKLKAIEGRDFDQVEEFIPEDEIGLTSEEVKSLKLSDEAVPENAPPTVIDPSLLYPEYISSPAPSVSMVSVPPIVHPLSTVQECEENRTTTLIKARIYSPPQSPSKEIYHLLDFPLRQPPPRPLDLAGDVTSRLNTLEKYWDEQGIIVGTVLKRMLWIVDTMIVKERGEAQRLMRRKEMGWMDSEDEGCWI